jgi:hypothetical protein
MTDLAWVASYPKSGNTWVRIMLAGYVLDRAVDGMATLNRTVPDFPQEFRHGRALRAEGTNTLAVKTHFLPTVEVMRPYRAATGKIIYIVRNPRDVILSSERFLHIAEEHRVAFAKHFLENRGVEDWRRTGWGSWPQHVNEWTSPDVIERCFPRAELCLVRYEDMRRDPVATLTTLVKFLELDGGADLGRVVRAVENSTLDRLREVERRDRSGTTEAFRANSPTSFFGPGLTGQSLAGYGDDVEAGYLRLFADDEEFAACAARFGYLAEPAASTTEGSANR